METPFIVGGEYTLTATIQFLWAISTEFKESDSESLERFIENRIVPQESLEDLYDGIDEYIEATFFDAPGGTGVTGVPYICSTAWFVYVMACKPFKWKEKRTLNTPIRRIYQYWKCQKFAKGIALRNSISDKIREDWLAARRKQQGQN